MKKDNRKNELVISIIAILVLIIAVVGVTYAAFIFTGPGTKNNTITTGSLTFNYTEDTNGISLVNAQPIADAVGKVLAENDPTNGVERGYFDFTVSSTASTAIPINYEVYGVDTTADGNKLDSQYVKVYLTDGEATENPITGYEGAVPTFSSLTQSTSDSSNVKAKRLYYGTFTGSDTKKFRLRIWVSSDYNVTNAVNTFTMKVNVKADA